MLLRTSWGFFFFFIFTASCSPSAQSMGSSPLLSSSPGWNVARTPFECYFMLWWCCSGTNLYLKEWVYLYSSFTWCVCTRTAYPWQNFLLWGLQKNFLLCWLLEEVVATDSSNHESTVLNILFLPSLVVHNNFICILIPQQYPNGDFAIKI